MRFYIDFENVTAGGLKGIEKLSESDVVRIYYSNNPYLNMETAKNMVQSKAKIQFEKMMDEIKAMNSKNALDIMILNDIAKWYYKFNDGSKIIVISNDRGYDAVIGTFSVEGQAAIRAASIETAINSTLKNNNKTEKEFLSVAEEMCIQTPKIDEQAINALFKKELFSFASNKQMILNIIKNSKTRSQINNALTKTFPNNTGTIMKALKPYIKDLPGR